MSNQRKINLVPLKSVNYRVLSVLPKDALSEDQMESWAYEAYEELAPNIVYQTEVEIVDVKNNKANIPQGATKILMILYQEYDINSNWDSRRASKGPNTKIDIETYKNLETGDEVHKETYKNVNINYNKNIPVVKHKINENLRAYQLYNFINPQQVGKWAPLPISTNVFHGANTNPDLKGILKECGNSFSIQHGCIVTSFEVGRLAIAYNSLPKDDNGDFLIPDKEPVKKAIETYIVKRYFQLQMNMGEDGSFSMYKLYTNEFEIFSPKATAALMMPTISDYQNMRNLNKYIKEDSPFSSALGALNNHQHIEFRDNRVARYGTGIMPYFTNFNIRR